MADRVAISEDEERDHLPPGQLAADPKLPTSAGAAIDTSARWHAYFDAWPWLILRSIMSWKASMRLS